MARILIVDDEQSIRRTLGTFLERDGHTVATAEDTESAQALIDKEVWDVVVTDIIMPGAGGVVLLEKIREQDPTTQVVLITGEPSVDTAAARRRGDLPRRRLCGG